VSQIVYHTRVPLKIGCTLKQYLELKFWNKVWKETYLSTKIIIYSTVTLKSWDPGHMKDNLLIYSEQLESSNLHL
jgi:hypothetical protein